MVFFKNAEYMIDDSIFALLEDYVKGSGEPGFINMGETPIAKDEIFRHLAQRKIMQHLDAVSKKIGTVTITSQKTNAIEWIKKRYFDKMIHSRGFNQIDFKNALEEFCSDCQLEINLEYNELPLKEWKAEYDAVFNSQMVELDTDELKALKEQISKED